jgi:hypothetical protein
MNRHLAITRRPTRRLPTKRTRPPTRKLLTTRPTLKPTRTPGPTPMPTRTPGPTPNPTPKPTNDVACQEPTTDGLQIACDFFGVSSLEKCLSSLHLSRTLIPSKLIPNEIGQLTNLTTIQLFSSQGPIPTSISCLTKLKYLQMTGDALTGTIPESMSSLTQLTAMYIYLTRMQGTIPEIFYGMKNMQVLELRSNRFFGNFPSSIIALTNLFSLDFRYNFFSGILPSLPSSLYALDIAGNDFTGISPLPIYLTSLSITYTKLEKIPSSLLLLTRLSSLDLSKNNFKGTIPSALSSITNLEKLDLRSNMLTGTIPQVVLGMKFLTYFLVYENNLTDSISSCGNKNIYVDCGLINCTCCYDKSHWNFCST